MSAITFGQFDAARRASLVCVRLVARIQERMRDLVHEYLAECGDDFAPDEAFYRRLESFAHSLTQAADKWMDATDNGVLREIKRAACGRLGPIDVEGTPFPTAIEAAVHRLLVMLFLFEDRENTDEGALLLFQRVLHGLNVDRRTQRMFECRIEREWSLASQTLNGMLSEKPEAPRDSNGSSDEESDERRLSALEKMRAAIAETSNGRGAKRSQLIEKARPIRKAAAYRALRQLQDLGEYDGP